MYLSVKNTLTEEGKSPMKLETSDFISKYLTIKAAKMRCKLNEILSFLKSKMFGSGDIYNNFNFLYDLYTIRNKK